jgi:curli biogenesis system outer membrane secretion channel CsgG
MKLTVRAALALALAGCATVSEKPAMVESPVPKQQQITAQQTQATPAAPRYKRKIAVARFSNETNYGRSLLTDADLDRIGKQASDMLASRLIMSGTFLVLERPDLQKVQREQQLLGEAGLVGADTLIVGSVTEFGRSVEGKVGFLSGTKVQTARAKVDVRLVDARSGHAYFSALGAGTASTESGQIAGYGSRAEYDATLNDRAIAAAISDLIDKLVSKLEDRPWRTDILDVQNGRVFISGGKRQGLKAGDVLAVMEPGNTLKSKQTGFDVSLPPKQVAMVKIVNLFGDSETNEGSVCDVVSGSIEGSMARRFFVTETAPRETR